MNHGGLEFSLVLLILRRTADIVSHSHCHSRQVPITHLLEKRASSAARSESEPFFFLSYSPPRSLFAIYFRHPIPRFRISNSITPPPQSFNPLISTILLLPEPSHISSSIRAPPPSYWHLLNPIFTPWVLFLKPLPRVYIHHQYAELSSSHLAVVRPFPGVGLPRGWCQRLVQRGSWEYQIDYKVGTVPQK